MNFEEIQKQHKKWVEYNFGDHDPEDPFLGIVEELGEMAHARLKRKEGIRGSKETHTLKIKDACGDICLYLMDFCRTEGYELFEALAETWEHVKKRDWKRYPENGITS